MPEHAEQGIDNWAQHGIEQSVGRESAESDTVEDVLSAPETTPAPHSETLEPPTEDVDPLAAVERPNTTAHPTLDGTSGSTSTPDGEPGTTSTPGDQAEHAAFRGDGAYSGGQAAGENYHPGGVQD